MNMNNAQLSGIFPALMTPYSPDGTVNVPMIRRLVRKNIREGCHGFFVCGSTGEGFLMTPDERKLMAQTVIEEISGQVPVIVHVGAVATREAADLAKHAKTIGADAVASVPPIYYPVGYAGQVEHLRAIAQASNLPTYCYHIPATTGVHLTVDHFMELLAAVDGLTGLKYTFSDLYIFRSILDAAGPEFTAFYGMDEQLLQGLVTGATGGIGSTYNYQLATIVQIYEAFQAGDIETARRFQWKANAIIRIVFAYGANLAVQKAIMKLSGYDVGPARLPVPPFPEERMEALRNDLDEAGFFEDNPPASQ